MKPIRGLTVREVLAALAAAHPDAQVWLYNAEFASSDPLQYVRGARMADPAPNSGGAPVAEEVEPLRPPQAEDGAVMLVQGWDFEEG